MSEIWYDFTYLGGVAGTAETVPPLSVSGVQRPLCWAFFAEVSTTSVFCLPGAWNEIIFLWADTHTTTHTQTHTHTLTRSQIRNTPYIVAATHTGRPHGTRKSFLFRPLMHRHWTGRYLWKDITRPQESHNSCGLEKKKEITVLSSSALPLHIREMGL